MKLPALRALVLTSLLALAMFLFRPAQAQDTGSTVGDRVGTATDQAKASIQEAGAAATDKIIPPSQPD